jgi:hypothetical protein
MNRISWPAVLLALLVGCLPPRRLHPVGQVSEGRPTLLGNNQWQLTSDYVPPPPPQPPQSERPPQPDRLPDLGQAAPAAGPALALPNVPNSPRSTAPTSNYQVANRTAKPPAADPRSRRTVPQPAPIGKPPAADRVGPELTTDAEPPVADRSARRPAAQTTAETRSPAADRSRAEGLRRPAAAAVPTHLSAGPTIRMVNGKRLRLGFQVRTAGADPVAVELWYTRDGKAWQRDDGPPQLKSPYVMEVREEGIYGLSLIPCNGGPKAQLPQTGDPPQFWVCVDWTRPAVTVLGVEPDLRKKALTVRWSASDDHLAPRPITLSYADQPGGPWLPLAANLKNTGNYWGPLPPAMPPRFYLRVEAADQGGNVGEAHTLSPVVLDPSPPPSKVQILGVGFDED